LFAIYFFVLKRVTKVYGSKKIMKLLGHDWDVIKAIRHHSTKARVDYMDENKEETKTISKKKK
jgi:hypothetical protein